MSGDYSCIKDFLVALNNCEEAYLVLRNYENIAEDSLYVDGHGDVDLLCENSRVLANKIGAKPWRNIDDGIHYYVVVAGQKVSLDLRSVGDGYYCEAWQRKMLADKIMCNGVFVMSEEDYFYSLIYHACLQKRCLSEEYRQRLNQKGTLLGKITVNLNEIELIQLLESFLKKNGYLYTYPSDFMVPLRKKLINRKLIKSNFRLAFKHWKFDTKVTFLEFLVKIKHFLQGKGFKYV